MLQQSNKKTELIIVCDKSSIKYANYLIQLLGQNDDQSDDIIGVKDGVVTAAIYTEKQYKDSLAKITSNTHILFIGNNSTTKEQAKHITFKFDDFGMHFGWLGKRAVMYVDKTINNSDEYDRFFDFGVKYHKNFTKVIETKNVDGTVVEGDIEEEKIPKALGKGAKIGFNFVKEKRAIKEQQYDCLTMFAYLEGLNEFLEE